MYECHYAEFHYSDVCNVAFINVISKFFIDIVVVSIANVNAANLINRPANKLHERHRHSQTAPFGTNAIKLFVYSLISGTIS